MKCKACKERGKTWKGDNPNCAFDGDSDNWNCATLNLIRDICEIDHELVHRGYWGDENTCFIDIYPIFEEGESYQLWVKWYKHRGRAEQCLILGDHLPHSAIEEELTRVIEYFEIHLK